MTGKLEYCFKKKENFRVKINQNQSKNFRRELRQKSTSYWFRNY